MLAEGKKLKKQGLTSRVLAEIAVMVALATVLSMIKIFQLPQGGSITLGSMIPILFVALRRGVKVGVLTGMIYGLVQLIIDGYIGVYNPVSLLLDYPIAFGALGLAGFFRKLPLVGVYAALTGRYLAHFVSGVVFFWMWAPEGWSPVLYSAIYNLSYILPEMAISAFILSIVLPEKYLDLFL